MCTKCVQHVKACVQNAGNCYNDNNIHISLCLVQNATDMLKSGKSCGNDGVSAKHFKLANRRINILMSIFYTSVITHGHLPDYFMKTIIIPLTKNKYGDNIDVNNYRPIPLVTVASKICKIILFDLIESYLGTTDNQFGF